MPKFDRLLWKAFLRASNAKNADVLIRRIAKALEKEVSVVDLRPYRKDKTLFEASFTTPLGMTEVQDALFESLRLADKLSPAWEVRPPQQYEGGKWDFAGSSDRKLTISGVVRLEFEAANTPTPA